MEIVALASRSFSFDFVVGENLMNGAIFYASKYGSTREYADWIADATGLPVYAIDAHEADPADFEFLVLGSPVIYYKLIFSKWVRRHLDAVLNKPTVLFTVSGAQAGKKLDGWIKDSLPPSLIRHMHHVALRGRQNRQRLTWYDWFMLTIAGLLNRDRQAAREEVQGFDYMDRDSIQPVVDLIKELQAANGSDALPHATNRQNGVSEPAGSEDST
ncbi:flavodoxin domain-containing protein [Aliiroseovarius sp. S1339]|uniref:flavodoxin domain-containing protein n=1 Tax=Aliiroseovarius sp. S1339 TaxID=2936990 RepID=UPI0020BE53A1|nr:flavodoxin domain-containing protein [Aliiroseovarius sp. S1339]MCK8462417.1 flavodoxin domain-containing protein [Aliiroseovarius sp. S1339]